MACALCTPMRYPSAAGSLPLCVGEAACNTSVAAVRRHVAAGAAPQQATASCHAGMNAWSLAPTRQWRPRVAPGDCHGHRRILMQTASAVSVRQVYDYTQLELETKPGIALFDITPQIREHLERTGVTEGVVNIISRHTTTAVTINECEPRLLDDIRQFLRKLAPPGASYLHNDLHLREAPEGWPGGWAAWAAQEPENAHSHLLSMVLGNSETIPVTDGKLALGQWQSAMLVELDGPRKRTVGVQIVGLAAETAE